MQDGLYAVSFETPYGVGAGVVVKHGASLSGGDTGYAWFGDISEDGATVSGALKVMKHDPSAVSVFGQMDGFTLSFTGSMNGPHGRLNAVTAAAPGVGMSISLRLIKG